MKNAFAVFFLLTFFVPNGHSSLLCGRLVSAESGDEWKEVGHGFHVNTRVGLEAAPLGVKGTREAMWGQPATLFEMQKYRLRIHSDNAEDETHDLTTPDGSPFFLNIALVEGFDVQDVTVTDDGNVIVANFLFCAYVWDRRSHTGTLVMPERNRPHLEKLNQYSTAVANVPLGTTLPASWFGRVTASKDGEFIEVIEEQMFVELKESRPYIYRDERGAFGNSGGQYGQVAWRRIDDGVSKVFISRIMKGENGWEMRTVAQLDGDLVAPSSAAWIDRTSASSLVLHTRTGFRRALSTEQGTAFLPQNQHGRVVLVRVGETFIPVFSALETSSRPRMSSLHHDRNALSVIIPAVMSTPQYLFHLQVFDLDKSELVTELSIPLPGNFPLNRIDYQQLILNRENFDLPMAIPIEGDIVGLDRAENDGHVLLVMTRTPDVSVALVDSRSALFDPIRDKFLDLKAPDRSMKKGNSFFYPKIEVRFGQVKIEGSNVEWISFLARARGTASWTPVRQSISLTLDQVNSVYGTSR